MDFNTIEVTQEQIDQVPEKDFLYATWQANYFIPINTCTYNPETKLYKIGANPHCDKKNIARYLKINAQRIMPDGTTEISYQDFMKLDDIEFFEIEKNDLNGNWMVHSKYKMLVRCWAKKGKKAAQVLCDELNRQANREYERDGKLEAYLELR